MITRPLTMLHLLNESPARPQSIGRVRAVRDEAPIMNRMKAIATAIMCARRPKARWWPRKKNPGRRMTGVSSGSWLICRRSKADGLGTTTRGVFMVEMSCGNTWQVAKGTGLNSRLLTSYRSGPCTRRQQDPDSVPVRSSVCRWVAIVVIVFD
jgi:hypothetical protein